MTGCEGLKGRAQARLREEGPCELRENRKLRGQVRLRYVIAVVASQPRRFIIDINVDVCAFWESNMRVSVCVWFIFSGFVILKKKEKKSVLSIIQNVKGLFLHPSEDFKFNTQ